MSAPDFHRRRTDRARVEQCREAIALLDALIAAREADSQVWTAINARYPAGHPRPTWADLQSLPQRQAYLWLSRHAEELYADYAAKWPRPETGGLTEPLDAVLRPPECPPARFDPVSGTHALGGTENG